jgi:hypothetical protein
MALITDADLKRYMADRHAFRREQCVLPNGKRYGDCEESWQAERVWGPLDSGQYHVLYLELARGHAKTTMGAMEVITEALLGDRLEVHFYAGDADQAAIGFDILSGMVRANPDLRRSFKLGKWEAELPGTGTTVKVQTSDSDTAFGIGGTAKGLLVVCDELWVWRHQQLWEAIISSTGKVGDNWRVLVLSNAGIEGYSDVAWKVREACRTQADPSFYFWRSPGSIASWITPEWKAQQRALLTPGGYTRLIDNEWTAGESSFIEAAEWDALAGDIAPYPESDRHPVIVGLDASKGATRGADTTAGVAVRRLGERTRLVAHRIWQPSGKGDIDLRATVLPWLVGLKERYGSIRVLYDPYNLSTLAQIAREAGVRMEELSQTQGNQTAFTGVLLDLVRSGGLVTYRAADLREQVLNAVMLETPRGIRLAKEKARRKIDGAVALAMACWGCQERGSRIPQPAQVHDLLALAQVIPERQRVLLPGIYGKNIPDYAIDKDRG